MKKILILMMLVISMSAFAERADNKDHEIENGISNEMQAEGANTVTKTAKKELDAGTREVIKEQEEYEMLDKEDSIGRD